MMLKHGWISVPICCALLLAPAALRAFDPGDDSPCEFSPLGEDGACGAGRFKMVYANNSGPASYCNSNDGMYCLRAGMGITPTPAWLECDMNQESTGATCTVWPQGDLHFNWAVDAPLYTSKPADWSGPSQFIGCVHVPSNGLVSVLITTPEGYTESVFAGVSCALNY